MEYKEAIDWLFGQLPMFSRVGAAAYKPGLERSVALARYFGNPHQRFKSIHVAGTNGKGSVSNLLAATLQSQGYKVGLYTSPHLTDFRERIRINGEMISHREVTDFVKRWQQGDYKCDKPSFFELTMMMAFEHFARNSVDYAVIEVGMGGRLDSTNIITPILSVITNISKDHTQFLGETLAAIAAEKAGIIKEAVPVVVGEVTEETEKVFSDKAEEMRAPLYKAYEDRIEKVADGVYECINTLIHCPLSGDYQAKNIRTALKAIQVLRSLGVNVSEESVKQGFAEVENLTGFRGRWTVLSKSPLTICDTGHNEAGLCYNLSQLRQIMSQRPGARLRFVIGFVADKDIDNILKLFPVDATYYLTQAQIPRALDYKELFVKMKAALENKCIQKEASPKGTINREEKTDAEEKTNIEERISIRAYPTVKEAIEASMKESESDDIIYIGGSTFIVADALEDRV